MLISGFKSSRKFVSRYLRSHSLPFSHLGLRFCMSAVGYCNDCCGDCIPDLPSASNDWIVSYSSVQPIKSLVRHWQVHQNHRKWGKLPKHWSCYATKGERSPAWHTRSVKFVYTEHFQCVMKLQILTFLTGIQRANSSAYSKIPGS